MTNKLPRLPLSLLNKSLKFNATSRRQPSHREVFSGRRESTHVDVRDILSRRREVFDVRDFLSRRESAHDDGS